MTRVKICGVNSEAAFDAVIEAGADWLGFVFFARSPRHVTPGRAAALSRRASGGPPRIGLFVEPHGDEIAASLDALDLAALQVYGSPALAAAMRARFGLPIWRAVGVASRAELPVDLDGADALLIEAKAPPSATRPGGNALALDWSMLADWNAPGPWLLAGGLTPGNVAEAIAASGAPAVDVSSGVETAPGVKDAGLIREFVRAAQGFSRRGASSLAKPFVSGGVS